MVINNKSEMNKANTAIGRWSGAKTPNGENRSQVEASPRLSEWRERMVGRGVRAGPVQMVFCTMGDEQCVV